VNVKDIDSLNVAWRCYCHKNCAIGPYPIISKDKEEISFTLVGTEELYYVIYFNLLNSDVLKLDRYRRWDHDCYSLQSIFEKTGLQALRIHICLEDYERNITVWPDYLRLE
jgi:hypothetical protein